MSTTQDTPAITEAQVVEWMKARCDEISHRTGATRGVAITFSGVRQELCPDVSPYFFTHAEGVCASAATAEAAINALSAKLTAKRASTQAEQLAPVTP